MKVKIKRFLARVGLLDFADRTYEALNRMKYSFVDKIKEGPAYFKTARYIEKKAKRAVWWNTLGYHSMVLKTFKPILRYENDQSGFSQSQYGQELYVLDHIPVENPGVFVEVGANDPVALSNSYFLEKQGWEGVSFEPISYLCERWKTERSTKCYPYLLGAKPGFATFIEKTGDDSVYSSVAGYGKRPASEDAKDYSIGQTERTEPIHRLKDILHDMNITTIDILFIDVEGFELAVLKGMDFKNITVKCLVVEDERTETQKGNNKVRRFLKRRKFKLVTRVGGDDIYVNASIARMPSFPSASAQC